MAPGGATADVKSSSNTPMPQSSGGDARFFLTERATHRAMHCGLYQSSVELSN